MGRGMGDRGVWWGILRGRYFMFVCLFVCLNLLQERKNNKKNSREDDFFLTHTSYMNLDFLQRHGRFHRRRTRLRRDRLARIISNSLLELSRSAFHGIF